MQAGKVTILPLSPITCMLRADLDNASETVGL
jgi:hypothetical protein